MLALVMTLGTAVPAMGQSQASTGQIAGSVVDAQGAAITGATVKAVNKQTGLERSITTGDDGLYQLVLLPPGTYTVTTEASGFTSTTVNDVEVVVGRTIDIKITLGASGVQEVVNVTAGAIQVQTTRSEADAVIDERAINNLPINGRRFQDFVTLTPTAQVEQRRGQISLAGQRGIYGANINVDGVDYNQPFFGGIRGGERANFAPTIPQESIKEFQVVASGYSAEFGRSTGGIVNAVTKSGTNDLHGTAFYLLRPTDFARFNEYFTTLQQSVGRDINIAPTQHQFGGSVGGPIKKDKLFFFGSYEQQKMTIPREVLFSNLLTFTPLAQHQEAFDYFKSLEEGFEQTNDAKVFLVRADYDINNNHRFNVRYSQSDLTQLNAVTTGNSANPIVNRAISNNGTEKDKTYTFVGQFASIFTPTLVNEFRGQYSRERRPRLANALEPNVTTSIGTFGTVDFLGENDQFDWRFQVADSMSWTRGNHSLKFGGEYNHVYVNQRFGFDQLGSFSFSGVSATADILDILSFTPNVTTGVLNRFDTTTSRYRKQLGNLLVDYASDEIAFFAQDSWRIRPNLTINYGLRWEAQYNPEPDTSNEVLTGLVKDFVFPSGHTVDPTQIPDVTDQWGPRFGFAWDPFSDTRTVIRGFAGIYYSRTPLLLLADSMNNFRNPPGNLTLTLPLTPAVGNPNAAANTVYKQLRLIGIDLNTFPLGQFPVLTAEQVRRIAELVGFNPSALGNPLAFAEDFKNPKSYQAGIGIEREITRSLTLGADYTHVKTVYLQRNRDLNLQLPVLLANDPGQRPNFRNSGAGLVPRPIPALGQVQVRESTAKSLYDALVLRMKFQRRWGQLNAFYTLSRNLTDDDNERSSGGFPYDDAFNLAPEYNYSEIDRRHQFTANPIVFLPWGFDVASAIRLRSGRPYDARQGSDLNQDGVNNDRPYSAPGIPFKRNAFRGLPIYTVDLRVQKRFNISEDKRLTFSFEIFNLFNEMNIEFAGTTATNFCASTADRTCGFLGPTNLNFLQVRDRTPNAATFGKILLNNIAGDPFQAQFGARFQF
jgi:hypothetical protein